MAENEITGKSPKDQFQIGDEVLYKPEGVYTTIRGYLWLPIEINKPPRIGGYELDCGITVPAEWIERVKNTSLALAVIMNTSP